MGRYSGKTCRLSFMLALTFSYFLVELIVGHVSHSLALIGDSYHMLSDVLALIVGLASVKISKMNSQKNTYGWARAEVLGALVNSVFLVALCFTVMIEAIQKLSTGENRVDLDKINMLLYVGAAGLLINIIGLIMFHNQGGHGHSHGGGGHSHGKSEGHGHSHGSSEGHGHSHAAEVGHSHVSDSKHKNQLNHNGHNHNQSNNHNGYSTGVTMTQSGSAEGVDGANWRRSGSEESASSDSDDCAVNGHVGQTDSSATPTKAKKAPKSSAQLNMRGVFLHVLGDALGSVGVMISALVIKYADGDWRFYVDPICSLVMVIIISFTSIRLFKESSFILLQTVPTHIKVAPLKESLIERVKGVLAVHEFHVWQLAGNRIIASLHIRCQTPHEYMRIAEEVKSFFHDEGIHSTTVQPEFVEYEELSPDRDCVLECGPDKTCFVDTCCARKKVIPRTDGAAPADNCELRQRNVASQHTHEDVNNVNSGNSNTAADGCNGSRDSENINSISLYINNESINATRL